MIYYNTYACYPIWEDIIQSTSGTALAGLDSATVEVYLGEDTLLFSGVVLKRPGDTYLRTRLNDIVAPFVRPILTLDPSQASGWIYGEVMPLFKISWNAGALVRRFYVFGDCSWDRARVYEMAQENPYCQASVLSALIDGKIVRGQRVFFTSLLAARLLAFKYDPSGAGRYMRQLFETVKRSEVETEAPTGGPATFFMSTAGFPDSATGKYDFQLRNGDETDAYIFGSVEGVELVNVCARYVLYYLNAYGGWDWFVIQGRVNEKDKITRTEYTRRPKTVDPMSRGRDVLQVEVKKSLEMHTHWLTDDEASRMHHLTESPAVFVHDLAQGLILPAVLTGSTHDYKTYKGQGGRLVSYSLDVDMAVTTQRQ